MQRYLWLVVLVAGGLLAWSLRQEPLSALLAVLLTAAAAWWLSPLAHGTSRKHRDVIDLPDGERRVIVYWRPGCIFCERLRGGLGEDAKRVHWVNIWQDAEAAEFVRSVNDGNEVVPTVVIDGVAHTNPDPRAVRDALSS
ncbi:glutaredoxin domain-containing protein [Tessaracoccus flavus]|jgi:glutaredoxin|uniref:Uncharacterized protein n=1 Tax=Tessaracoccus flavus TaxID=1610493 RepID=A0A1Q2CBY9_9ACTN|nr:glutaredoxin domain-containing protein [Tessaracoccus flavus]AQP43617.1 hypothetical protein RPIT_01280 [Tessaracoccus flavus]SDZ00980.1 Glutaredoxin [Tessaracoccus flavus]